MFTPTLCFIKLNQNKVSKYGEETRKLEFSPQSSLIFVILLHLRIFDIFSARWPNIDKNLKYFNWNDAQVFFSPQE